MTTIRRGQMDGMSSYMRQNFEDRMVEHLDTLFPKKTAALGEPAVRAQIQESTTRAQTYYVENENDVARFVDLDFMLGPQFEEKPEMKWAKQILNDRKLAGEEKMQRIYKQMPRKLAELAPTGKATGGRG